MRKINFSAGPSRLPEPVLKRLQEQLYDHEGQGMSILEMSHRSKTVEGIINDAKDRLTKIMNIPDGYSIGFFIGGASLQFINIPLNFLSEGKVGAYVNTGSWSKKAIKEAKKFGDVQVVASSEEDGFFSLPNVADITAPENAAYLHITSNNTIYGTQYKEFPSTPAPLIADMSSDILCKNIDVSQFSMIYAGAQKNVGPAGVTIVIVKNDLLEQVNENLPSMQDYKLIIDNNSLYNTPPVFQIHAVNEVFKWIEEVGGLDTIESWNLKKGEMLYGVIEKYPDFYKCPLAKEARSIMNVPFRLPDEELEAKFIKEAAENNLVSLKGHRSVGGIRVSMYNALLPEDLQVLCDFMEDFANKQ